MPVLYVALGRRLGYPLKLVTTKAHVFLRWDSPEERFDLEATGRGMNPYDDNHFRQWPYPVTEEEVRTGGFLKSLTPPEELALFLSLRGNCLMEAGRASEAIASYAHAVRLAPDTQPYQALLSAAREAPAPPQSGSQIAAAPFPTRLSLPRAGVTVPVQAAQPPDPNPLLKIR
jgi:hypothetical protein